MFPKNRNIVKVNCIVLRYSFFCTEQMFYVHHSVYSVTPQIK